MTKPRKPRGARQNPPSTWPAQSVVWPVATNAGPFLPQMFPFGTGGIRQDYALKNTGMSEDDNPKNWRVFASLYGPFIENVRYFKVFPDRPIYVLVGIKQMPYGLTYNLGIWDDAAAIMPLDWGLYIDVPLKVTSYEESRQLLTVLVDEARRRKLIWLNPKYVGFYPLRGRGTPVLSARFYSIVYTLILMPAGKIRIVRVDERDALGTIQIVANGLDSILEAKAYVEMISGV